MTLDLFLFEHPQVQHASTPIGYLKEFLNCHWLLLKTYVKIANMLCPTWALLYVSENGLCRRTVWLPYSVLAL
jgi:hypothetical protein